MARLPCLFSCVAVVSILSEVVAEKSADLPIRIGHQLELFVDDFLIDRSSGVELKLATPRAGGVALTFDRPWEGVGTSFVTVFQDGDRYRMYYVGGPSMKAYLGEAGETAHPGHAAVIAAAESSDGIHWTRPSLDLYEFQGSRDNNIVWMDTKRDIWGPGDSLCMYVFKDEKPIRSRVPAL